MPAGPPGVPQHWNIPARRPALSTVDCGVSQSPQHGKSHSRPFFKRPSYGVGSAAYLSGAKEDDSDSRTSRDSKRAQFQLPADLHRRTPAADRSEPDLERLFDGHMGGRRLGGADERYSQWNLAG